MVSRKIYCHLNFFPHFNFVNRPPGIPPKLFKNEESLVFKKCLWYIFCAVSILLMNQIIMHLSRDQTILLFPLQFHSLYDIFHPAPCPKKLTCKDTEAALLPLASRWVQNPGELARCGKEGGLGLEAFIPPNPSSVLHGWLHSGRKVAARTRQPSPHSAVSSFR